MDDTYSQIDTDEYEAHFCVSCENGDAQRIMQREAHLCMSCSKDDCRGASARCGGCSECIALQWMHSLGEELSAWRSASPHEAHDRAEG